MEHKQKKKLTISIHLISGAMCDRYSLFFINLDSPTKLQL